MPLGMPQGKASPEMGNWVFKTKVEAGRNVDAA